MDSIGTERPSSTLSERISTNGTLYSSLFVLVLLVCLAQAISFQVPDFIKHKNGLTDFNAFYITGKLVWEGHANAAYDWQAVRAAQLQISGATSFMPWSYLPQFTAFVALFTLFPIGVSYFLFTVGTFLFFDRTLKKLSGRYFPAAMAFAFPAILVNARVGQNGFLTAALIGNFLVLFYKRDWKAGWFLGSMLVKPHLAGAITFIAFTGRCWKAILVAAGLALSTAAIVSVLLGKGIWIAFLNGSRAAGEFLWHGFYPLERMTSLYAGLSSLGISPGIALAVHAAVALLAVVGMTIAFMRRVPQNQLSALVATSTLLISPYNYDYDQVTLCLAAGLIFPDVIARAKGWEILLMGFLCWISTINPLASNFQLVLHKYGLGGEALRPITASPFALILLIAFTLIILHRPVAERLQNDRSAPRKLEDGFPEEQKR